MGFLAGLFTSANTIIVSLVFTVGVTAGTWIGSKFFSSPPVPWKKTEIKYQLPSGEVVRGNGIVYEGMTFYPSSFINSWLKDKVKTDKRLK